jgi:hypothetical protein
VPRFREEVLNVTLAQLLEERGVVSTPEQTMHVSTVGRRMPDLLVVFQGLRTVIEGKIADGSGVEAQALHQASAPTVWSTQRSRIASPRPVDKTIAPTETISGLSVPVAHV